MYRYKEVDAVDCKSVETRGMFGGEWSFTEIEIPAQRRQHEFGMNVTQWPLSTISRTAVIYAYTIQVIPK